MNTIFNKVLWLIPARSGSKSIINKNIKLLGGIPLLAYRIKSAIKISPNENVWLSTDSDSYAEIGSSFGALVPFIRPANLSSDQASSIDVVLHAMQFAEQSGKKYDFIGVLEPTSPFIYSETLKDALILLSNNQNASSIVAVKATHPNTFFIQEDGPYLKELSIRFGTSKKLGRQAFGKQITPSGGFYITKWDAFKKFNTFYTEQTLSYEVPPECSLEIDEPMDWDWAEFLLQKGTLLHENKS